MIDKIKGCYERISSWLVPTLLFIVIIVIVSCISWRGHTCNTSSWCSGFLQNLSTEACGGLLTFLLINVWLGKRELKKRLILWMGSELREVAVKASEELRAEGWLTDGSLRKQKLDWANLKEAKLQKANLTQAILANANLEGADLRGAQLTGANLVYINLKRANLTGADLEGANLFQNSDLTGATLVKTNFQGANLQGAYLLGANLEGACLAGANLRDATLTKAQLQGANLEGANLCKVKFIMEASFDEQTTLPGGTKWTPDTDMARFTDPEHPDFWRSDNPGSPAYRGEETES